MFSVNNFLLKNQYRILTSIPRVKSIKAVQQEKIQAFVVHQRTFPSSNFIAFEEALSQFELDLNEIEFNFFFEVFLSATCLERTPLREIIDHCREQYMDNNNSKIAFIIIQQEINKNMEL